MGGVTHVKVKRVVRLRSRGVLDVLAHFRLLSAHSSADSEGSIQASCRSSCQDFRQRCAPLSTMLPECVVIAAVRISVVTKCVFAPPCTRVSCTPSSASNVSSDCCGQAIAWWQARRPHCSWSNGVHVMQTLVHFQCYTDEHSDVACTSQLTFFTRLDLHCSDAHACRCSCVLQHPGNAGCLIMCSMLAIMSHSVGSTCALAVGRKLWTRPEECR